MQPQLRTRKNFVPLAIAAIAFAIVPMLASAQSAAYRVLINGVAAGAATAVTNLPADTVVMHQESNPTIPPKQALSAEQGSVVVTTADPALVSAIQTWMKADNSGFKDTVQRKSVEIDRLAGTGPASRFQLSDAWPSRIDVSGGSSMITIVYQRLTTIP